MYEISAKPVQIVYADSNINLNHRGREKLVAPGAAFYPIFIFVNLDLAGQCVHAGWGLTSLAIMSPSIYPCFLDYRLARVTFYC